MKLPIPPGLSDDDFHHESTVVIDYGDCVALYCAQHGMGGVYRHNPGIWQLWFPIDFDDFTIAASRFVAAHGMNEQMGYDFEHAVPSMRLN